MKILVINSGSSSLKYQLIDMQTEQVLAKGNCERIGIEGSNFIYKAHGNSIEEKTDMPNHNVAVKLVLAKLTDKKVGVISSMKEIDGVGHRVVASGEAFKQPALVTPESMELMEEIKDLAPLHNPAAIVGVKACLAEMPNTPMVLVFDTGFHFTMPDYAYMYAVDYEHYEKYKIRRYGAHGTSHKYVAQEAAKYLGKDIAKLKIITCHLGNGSSITAVDGGTCIDTSMGFTPLAGVPMGTRSGDIDYAAAEYIAKKEGLTVSEMLTYLNKKCGMLGVSGISSDFRDLSAAAESGNKRAELALNMFSYSCKKYIGAYAAAMNGVDAIVFTAGVGENDPDVRRKTLQNMEYLGVKLDEVKNASCPRGAMSEIQTTDSKVKILVIPTNEELVIARETKAVAKLS
ncbi:MAG: acetate kinase [Corallococcus sp.]|nr:acetate kinase [Corallococcus sp.]MCM1359460.1 acetate kinase [Corallococcus sp.]MCM1394728.1 acetate kinase [Corallococcus sp.]